LTRLVGSPASPTGSTNLADSWGGDTLVGVPDPEEKRETIGATFINVFEEASKLGGVEFLAQGTLSHVTAQCTAIPSDRLLSL
jgi:hypothetical protein